eukprot:Sdes_comp17618_c0_seq1m6879
MKSIEKDDKISRNFLRHENPSNVSNLAMLEISTIVKNRSKFRRVEKNNAIKSCRDFRQNRSPKNKKPLPQNYFLCSKKLAFFPVHFLPLKFSNSNSNQNVSRQKSA